MTDKRRKSALPITKLRRLVLVEINHGRSPWSELRRYKQRFITRTVNDLSVAGLIRRAEEDDGGDAGNVLTDAGRDAMRSAS